MPNDGSEEFLSAAEQDLSALEDLKYFGFRSANTACFLAQQYAEKMIKARLLQLGLKFERSHNLVFLMDDLGPGKNLDLARDYCRILNQYEAGTRYPYDGMRIYSSEDAEQAYELALEIPYLIGLYEKDSSNL